MHLKTFEHPRIPYVSENPPPWTDENMDYIVTVVVFM